MAGAFDDLLPDEKQTGGAFGDLVPKSTMQAAQQHGKNVLGGLLRGAGSIGATFARPFESGAENEQRRTRLDENARLLIGAEPESWMYKGGKLGGEIAGTAGIGGVIAKPLQALAATRYGASIEPLLSGAAQALKTGGFRVGDLAGTSTGMAARAIGGVTVGGASAGLVNPEDAGFGALVGGVMPLAAQAAGKFGAGIKNSITGGGVSPEVSALANRAKELGINIPADRLVNSRPLNAMASSLNYLPFSGRAATEDAMSSQLNQQLSKTFGQNSSNVTMALRQAQPKLGREFDRVLQGNAVRVDQQFMQDLAESGSRAGRELSADGASIINKQIDDILAKAGTGEIDGKAAYVIKRTLDRIGNRNSPEAFYAGDLKKGLMGALNRSLGPDEAASFATTRQQYGNMLDLKKLSKNGVDGEVSVARLANMQNINNPQMQELADIAAQFVKTRESQHGAAQRVVMGTGASMAGFMGGGLLGGVAGLGAAAATGRGMNSLLNSNTARNYLLSPSLLGEVQPMGLLSDGIRRTLPLLSYQP